MSVNTNNNTYHITASGHSFVNTGDSHHLGTKNREALLNLLLPSWKSSGSLDLSWDHLQAKKKRVVDKTGEWILDSGAFKPWRLEPGSFLWLHGIAGCGKTVLSSIIIDHLRDSSTGNSHVAGYYFNAREDEKRNVSRLLRSLILQLCPAEGVLPAKVNELHDRSLSQDFPDDLLLDTLEYLIRRQEHTYIVIDALDECDMSHRVGEEAEPEKLAKLILRLTSIEAANLHLLITSRDGGLAGDLDLELRNIFQKNMTKNPHHLELDLQEGTAKDKIKADIEIFVESELDRWNKRKGKLWLPLNATRRSQVANAVKNRADGMFRLAACLLDLLWRKSQWEKLELALDDLPPELPEVYDRIFQDIKNQEQMETARILVRWLLYSERPLRLEELTEVTMADAQGDSFKVERGAQDESYVSSTLSSFIIISDDYLVQFAHQTVKDYLLLDTTEGGFFAKKEESQIFLANCCLAYMQFCDRFDPERNPTYCHRWQRYLKAYVLLEYVFNNWYRHVLLAWNNSSKADHHHGHTPSLEAATLYDAKTNRSIAGRSLFRIDDNSEAEDSPQSLSEWAASLKVWLKQVPSIELVPYYNTTKALACKGYERFVELLLAIPPDEDLHKEFKEESDADSDFGPKALTAALLGHYKLMAQLMLKDRVIDMYPDSSWWPKNQGLAAEVHTPAHKSHERIVCLLLDLGMNANLANQYGLTALHTAAFQGRETTMKTLLEKGGNINVRDGNGRTALHIASFRGHDKVTRLLLDKGADIRARDNVGWTALDLAVQNAVMSFNPQHDQVEHIYGNIHMHNDTETPPPVVMSNNKTVARTLRLLSERAAGLDYSKQFWWKDMEIAPTVVMSNHETAARAAHLLPGKEPDLEDCGTETPHAASANIGVVTIWRETATLPTATQITRSMAYGWTVTFSWGREVDLLSGGPITLHSTDQGNFDFFSTDPENFDFFPIDPENFDFFPTAQIQEIYVSRGNFTFSLTAEIKSIRVSNSGTVTFSSAAEIKSIPVWGSGTVTFSSTAEIESINVWGSGTVIFSSTAEIESINVWDSGTVTFSSTAEIESINVWDSGTVIFSSTAEIKSIDVWGSGTVTFSPTAKIKRIKVYSSGTVTFSSTAEIESIRVRGSGTVCFLKLAPNGLVDHQGPTSSSSTVWVENLEVHGGTVDFMYGIFREIMNLLLRDTVGVEGRECNGNSAAQIDRIRICGGSFSFSGNGRIGVIENPGGNVLITVNTTALHLAARHGHEALARLFLEKGADPNARSRPEDEDLQLGGKRLTSHGWTALHEAASAGHEAIFKLLLENGADVDIKDDLGRTALQIATFAGTNENCNTTLGRKRVRETDDVVDGRWGGDKVPRFSE